MAAVAISTIAVTPRAVPPTMAATGAGLLRDPDVEEPAVVLGDIITKDCIVNIFTSLKPPLGAVLVAPPSLLYVGGRSEIISEYKGEGERGGRVRGASRDWI